MLLILLLLLLPSLLLLLLLLLLMLTPLPPPPRLVSSDADSRSSARSERFCHPPAIIGAGAQPVPSRLGVEWWRRSRGSSTPSATPVDPRMSCGRSVAFQPPLPPPPRAPAVFMVAEILAGGPGVSTDEGESKGAGAWLREGEE